MSREKFLDPDYADRMNSPLPGAMMPKESQEKLVPKKSITPSNDAKQKPHYSDDGDQNQTIPV